MPLSAGSKLGAYEIIGSLGAGGMGEVFRARDSRLGREVALKILPPDVTNDPGRLERFDREARAIAALNHPHIVTIYSTEHVDNVRFLTMELVEGRTLAELISAGPLPLMQFLEIGVALSDALSAAHQKQITHRDLKPGNVMLSDDGRVKVLDFGLASIGGLEGDARDATRAALTQAGMVVGTTPYMSPEQVEGRALDPRSDVFSLGVVLYELLTAHRPFTGPSPAAVMSSILRDAPRPVSEIRPDIPQSVSGVVAKCLDKRVDGRMQTREVQAELRRIQQQESGVHGSAIGSAARAASVERSIAVLPFSDLSATRDQDWFCDGIAEEILNALSPLPGLRVAARASSFSLRGKTEDLRAIGDKLQVEAVLEGSVRRAGDRVRITAQLSDVRQGRQIWSERFDRELKDIFDVQDEIARAIVERLKVTLIGHGETRLVPKVTSNLEAYQLLLKGREMLTRRGRAIFDAMRMFEQVVALDPNLAEAHALLGDAHRLTALYGLVPPAEGMPRAREAAERALAIDPKQVEALTTLANIESTYRWDAAASHEFTARALAIDPYHVRATAERAIADACAEPTISAAARQRIVDDMRRARERDPLNAWVMSVESMCLACLGELPEAVATAERAVAMDRANFTAHWTLVLTLAWVGRDADARQAAEPALAISGRHPRVLAELAAIATARGEAGAESIHHELRERAATSYIGLAEQAVVAASAGRIDEARRLLAGAIDDRDPFLRFWKFPAWRHVIADAQCDAMLRASGLFSFDSE
jgi:serine/threonine protein kinase/tetratricopeptide (TPR) repeat protein